MLHFFLRELQNVIVNKLSIVQLVVQSVSQSINQSIIVYLFITLTIIYLQFTNSRAFSYCIKRNRKEVRAL
jgi:hypothetical protein